MNNEVYSFALKNTLDEIRNICPDITHAFMFRENGEIVIGDQETPEKTMTQAVEAFNGIFEKAGSIGQVECITLDSSNGRVNVFFMNDLYFLIVSSINADMNYVNTVTRVLIPTILRLVEKICPTPLKSNSLPAETEDEPQPKIPMLVENEEPECLAESIEENPTEEPENSAEPETKPEPSFPEPPTNQLIVENLGGLLVPSDTVRIDSAILAQWEELYEGKKIQEVEIETFDGKNTTCKVKPIKDSKYDGKGTVQMPEKIQSTLEIKKGALVRAKPIVE